MRRNWTRAIDPLLLTILGLGALSFSAWLTMVALDTAEQRRDERTSRLALYEVVDRTTHLERTLIDLGADPELIRAVARSARAESDPDRKLERVDVLIEVAHRELAARYDPAPHRRGPTLEALRGIERVERARADFVRERHEWIATSETPMGRLAGSFGRQAELSSGGGR